jgi:thiamine-phosphate pyrophosphorylase
MPVMTIEWGLIPIYPLTADIPGMPHVEQAEAFVSGGARLLQVRSNVLSDRELYRELLLIRRICTEAGCRLMVNNRADLAWACDADGVHLGQADLPVKAARRLLGKSAIIGLSTHNREQFQAAVKEPVDYIAVGPVFPTETKPSDHPTVGLELLRSLALSSKLPVVAIGGIDLQRAPDVWRAGAKAVAVISDLFRTGHPQETIADYIAAARRIA